MEQDVSEEKDSKQPDSGNSWKVFWRIVKYLKNYIGLAILCIVFSMIISVCYFGSLGMLKPVGDILFENADVQIVDTLHQYGPWGTRLAAFLKENLFYDKYRALYIMMGVILFFAIIKNIMRVFQEYIANYLTIRISIDLANELFAKVKRLPTSFFTEESESKITARFVNDIAVMAHGLKNVFTKGVREPLKALAAVILAFIINWKLTILSVGVFPLAVFLIKYLGKKVKHGTKKTLAQQGNLMTILQETFQGIKIVKSYQMEDVLQEKFENQNKKLLRYQKKIAAADSVASPAMETFITVIGIGVLIFTAHQVLKGEMSSGGFCAFYAALAAILDPVRKLSTLYNNISGSAGAGERVFNLLDQTSEFQDSKNYMALPDLREKIQFDHVYFSYQPGKLVLEDICFSVNKGECIAVVGPSGAGKTTMLSLLSRFYDVDQGAILIDGHDIRSVTLESLRRQIGLVTQEAFLFHDTILSNIICRKDGSSKVDELVTNAAHAAHAHHFIEQLPKAYETCYGEGHVELSGGQKHRIALTRAFFKSPNILILDEAMANLDAESESYIKNALERITQGRTTFIIAHRFSTIEKADRILVLNKEGRLEAFGSHDQIFNTSPTYRTLYEQQLIARNVSDQGIK